MVGDLRQAALYQHFYTVIKRIPAGQVATYRQIAQLAGEDDIRQIGYALAAVNDASVPWHRVVNSNGEISHRANKSGERERQRQLLLAEGVEFIGEYTIPMQRFGWQETPPDLFG